MTTIDPTDMRALEVMADQLQEQGDVRGEFMTLQCRQAQGALSVAGRRRLSELRRSHLKGLLGELHGLVTRAHFKRGLLHSGGLHYNRERLEAAWGSPRWSTLEILDVHHEWSSWFQQRSADFFNSRPSLHAVLNLGAVPNAPCPRVTTISMRRSPDLDELAKAFPNLKRLAIESGADSPVHFWNHPCVRGLEVLVASGWWLWAGKLMWTKDRLHLDGSPLVENSQLQLIGAGPPLEYFEVPLEGSDHLYSEIAQTNSNLGELIDAAKAKGAQLVFASSVPGYRLPRGDRFPARFLRAVQ